VLPERYRHNKLLFKLLSLCYKALCYSLFLPIKIKGKKNLLTDQPMIIAANHQSALDIPLLGLVIGSHPHIWLVLAHYSTTPILGFIIRKICISVEKDSPQSAAQSLIKLLRLAQKTAGHIIIFPEGGRFVDGTIHPFFAGFALLAKKTGRPVLPVFMPYNGDALYPESLLLRYACLTIIIGKPFTFESDDTDDSFTERIYNWFVAENKKLRT
jgi:1-acyl-sn-glycerol-3-phosphate acyltransferase